MYNFACPPSEDSDQHVHPIRLFIVFTLRMKKHWLIIDGELFSTLLSDCKDVQAELHLL